MSGLTGRSAVELAELMATGEVSAREVVDAHLERVAQTDGPGRDGGDRDVHAFLTLSAEQAREHAGQIDERRSDGDRLGPLAGVPVAVKDVLTTRGTATTCGSRMLADWRPPYDATVVRRLADADAVMLGKTNMDEFAMGSSTENSAFGPTRNPWDLDRVPGGSSGGSAAAVAAGQAPLSVGTDTGGSIRQPAALCGIVGAKPTYGLVSRHGLVAFGSSLDQAGPMARTVEDAALLQSALQGYDDRDSTSIPEQPPDLLAELRSGVEGLVVGVVEELAGEGFEPGVEACVGSALELLEELGAEVRPVSLPHVVHGLPAYYMIAPSEASSNLARFDGTRYGLRVDGETAEEMNVRTRAAGFGAEVKRRIMIGTHALSSGYYDAYYLQASKVRTLIRRDFEKAFGEVDVLASPTSPGVAFELGAKTDDPLAMYLQDVASVSANLAGIPALSVPAGLARGPDGGRELPVGLQLMGPVLGDAVIYRVAWAFEQAAGFDPTPHGPGSVAEVDA